MLNKIIHFSLHNRAVVLVCALVLMIAGGYTTQQIEVDVFPDLNAPTVVVMTEAKGMAPEEVEQQITFPIETAVNGASGVRRVRSSSSMGFSVVWVEFDWDTEIYTARQIVSEKIAVARESLPSQVGNPILAPQSSILGEVLFVSLTSSGKSTLSDLRTFADRSLRPRLLSTGGVAQVTVLGGDIKEYQIVLNPHPMQQYGITLDEVRSAVEQLTINASGGLLTQHGNEYILRAEMASLDPEELANSVIKQTAQGSITLGDVAKVQIGAHTPKLGLASVDGTPAVLLTITKQPHVGTIELTQRLDALLSDVSKQLPSDVTLRSDAYRQERFIANSISNVKQSLWEGAIFVVLVLALFLANVRTTIISLITIPLSLISALLALKWMGMSINTMSLGGMAIAIGSLVDDAIVDVENVYKRLRANRLKPQEERQPALQVVYEASQEVRLPILYSTFIVIASFAPLFFLSGFEGRLLIPLGVSFIVALASSTVIALTLTPVLCSLLLAKEKTKKETTTKEPWLVERLKNGYAHALEWVLNHRKGVLVSVGALAVAAIISFGALGRSFLPPFNEGSFTINISTLPGVSLEESDRLGRMAERLLGEIPEVVTVARKTGRAELDEHAQGSHSSELEAPFILKERSKEALMQEVRTRLSTLPGVNIEVGAPISHRIDAMLSGTRASIAIKLFGNNLNTLFALGNEIKESIAGIEGITDLNVEQQVERPQLRLRPKREILQQYGISIPELSKHINVMLGGEVVSQVYEGNQAYDLVLKGDSTLQTDIDAVRDLLIDTPQGKIALSEVMEISSTTGPNIINRENVARKIVISCNTQGRALGSIVSEIQERIQENVSLPEGYHVEYGGQFESERAASRTLLATSLIAILVILVLLYYQFRSIKLASTIMLNLPLALIGGVLILWLTGGVVSIPAIIGFISLFGIATRNGMLLISRYLDLEAEGHSPLDSVRQGSLDRLNPILMTALSTALALLPLVIGGALPGNEIQSPMAVVILGGLFSSTLLNAFIIPIVYTFIHNNPRS